jgi:ketosteroid isomerase-like protein
VSAVSGTVFSVTTTPAAIDRYYAASESGDTDALVACFTPDATVLDDGHTYHGHAEIRAWREGLATAFTYTQEVTGLEQTAPDEYIASTHVEGNFPGGVVDLTNRFRLDAGLIADLAI